MSYKKICVECGKEFVASNIRYINCSKECARNRNRKKLAEYQRLFHDKVYLWQHNYHLAHYKPAARFCKICEQEITEPGGHKYHEKCVVEVAQAALSAGFNSHHPDVARARNVFGYLKSELIEMMEGK